MATSSTPNRNYTHPEKDEDLESSNTFFRINLFAIDTDIQALFDDKANSVDVYLKTETYTKAEVDTEIDQDITAYDTALTWTSGFVRGDTSELNLRTDTMASPGVYSSVTVGNNGLVTAGTSIINDAAQGATQTYSSDKIETMVGAVDPAGNYVPTGDYSDQDVLDKILNVDGTGTGLDADKLDGQEGTYFLSWTNFTSTPTTLAGYSISDALAKNAVNGSFVLGTDTVTVTVVDGQITAIA